MTVELPLSDIGSFLNLSSRFAVYRLPPSVVSRVGISLCPSLSSLFTPFFYGTVHTRTCKSDFNDGRACVHLRVCILLVCFLAAISLSEFFVLSRHHTREYSYGPLLRTR